MFATPVQTCRQCPLDNSNAGRCPFSPVKLPAGVVVCGQGEVHGTTYFVKEGTVALHAVDADGAEGGLALRGPRSLLCLEALRGQPSPYEVRTVTPTTLCGIPVASLAQWTGPEASPARVMLDLCLVELDNRQQDLGWQRGDSLSRVARFILASSFRGPTGRPLQKQLVAKMLGMRPETFSRCLARLIERGAIDRGPGIKVINTEALASLAT